MPEAEHAIAAVANGALKAIPISISRYRNQNKEPETKNQEQVFIQNIHLGHYE